jgi:predicted transcriptional regulator YdeE
MVVYWVRISLVGIALTIFGSGDLRLTPKITTQTEFMVVGISVRTSNAKEASGEGVIKIPNKVDSEIVVVYSDYESDANGAYNYTIGAKVNSISKIPPRMAAKKVPAGRYAVFTSEKGFVGKVVPETWSRIWALPKSVMGGDRAYQADFEIYDQRAADREHAQVDIYVGIK